MHTHTTYAHTHTHAYTYIHTHTTYAHTHIYVQTHKYICTHTHMHTYTYVHNTYTYVHTHTHTHTHMHTHTYIHTYYICTHTHTHTHTQYKHNSCHTVVILQHTLCPTYGYQNARQIADTVEYNLLIRSSHRASILRSVLQHPHLPINMLSRRTSTTHSIKLLPRIFQVHDVFILQKR